VGADVEARGADGAQIGDYDSTKELFFLEPVSTEVR
jgi:hypothetical protein